MRILLMGGSRFMGPAIVDHLVRDGHELVVFNRGTRPLGRPDVAELRGDRNRPQDLAQLGSQPPFDAVIDQSGYTGEQTALLLDVVGETPLWLHCSSGAIYAPQLTFPWSESDPQGPWSIWGSYGQEKLACETQLQNRHDRLATVVLRLPYVLGPGNYAPREEFVFNRLLDDAPILLPGDGQALVQFVNIDQVAYAFGAALRYATEHPGWHAFNIAGPRAVTSLRGFVTLCEEVAGRSARIVPTEEDVIVDGVFNPAEAFFPFPNQPYVLDLDKAREVGVLPPEVSVVNMLAQAHDYLLANRDRRDWNRTGHEQQALAALGVRQ